MPLPVVPHASSSMDEVTVVTEGLVPAVASTLLGVVHSFGRFLVFMLLRFFCTFGVCFWWPFVLLFAGFYAVYLAARVPLLDVSLFFLDVSAASYLDLAVALVRFGPLLFPVVRRQHSPYGGHSSSTSRTFSRKDSPLVYYCRRGSRCSAVTGLDLASRSQAMSVFIKDVSAASAADSAVSLVRTWSLFHIEWFGDNIPIFPLTPESVEVVGALLERGEYCVAASFYSAPQDRHLAVGFKWSEFLDRSFSRIERSVSRGFGPPRLWAVLVGFGMLNLELPLVSSLPGPPLGLKTSLHTGVLRVKSSSYCSRTRDACIVSLAACALRLMAYTPPHCSGGSRQCCRPLWPSTSPLSAVHMMSRATSRRKSRTGNRAEVNLIESHPEVWTLFGSQRQFSETLAVVIAIPWRNITNTLALADLRDEFFLWLPSELCTLALAQ